MKSNRLLFLDFDGVLNHEAWLRQWHDRSVISPQDDSDMLDPSRIALIDRIVRETGTDIVISSTWRRMFILGELNRMLRDRGLSKDIVGKTPTGSGPPKYLTNRGSEINVYLSTSLWEGEVDSFVIVDDDSDMDPHADRLVQTDYVGGIEEHHIPRIISQLERPLSKEEIKKIGEHCGE